MKISLHLKSLFVVALFSGLSTLNAQKSAVALNLGYHYNPDDFYLSPAELDSNFSPEQGLRFGARFKYRSFFGASNNWSWHLQAEYSYRSIKYQFQTPFTDEEKFTGELEGRYLDLGLGVDQRFNLNEKLKIGWSATAAIGIPFQSDTATSETPPYPLRRATNYLPYLELTAPLERIFSESEKGFWFVGIEPTLRLYTSPLYKQNAQQSIFAGLGFSFGIGYAFF